MQSSHDPSFSLRLLKEINQDAVEIKQLLSTSTLNAGPFSDLVPSDSSGPLKEVSNFDDVNFWESPRFTHYQAIDLWRAESLVHYSAIRTTIGVLKSESLVADDLASTCQKLVLALRKLLGSLNIASIINIADEYGKMCEENAFIRAQSHIASAINENSPFTKISRSSKKLDLDRTEVFEAIEKVCTRVEYEKDTLEIDLRNARYDLKRAQESLEVAQKTIAYVKTQLESEKIRSASLESESYEILSHIRGLACDLNCSETASNDLQLAQSLSRRVKRLLSALPWLRSWRESDVISDVFNLEINPYHLLQLKEKELNAKTQSLFSANSFIEQLTNDLNSMKSEKSRLNKELESKDRIIQKFQEVIAEKTAQIERYRATFDGLFDPTTAANFARQVAERYNRYNSSVRSKNSGDVLEQAEAVAQVPQPDLCMENKRISTHSSRLDAEHPPTSNSSRLRRETIESTSFHPTDIIPATNKNISEKKLEQCHPGIKGGHGISQTSHGDAPVKKPIYSPILAGSKRSRLAENPPKLPSSVRPNPAEAERNRLPRQSQQVSRAPTSHQFLSSDEKHDPACTTS